MHQLQMLPPGHLHDHIAWIALLALSGSIELVSSIIEQFGTGKFGTADDLALRTIWHCEQFGAAENLALETIRHCRQFGPADNLAPWIIRHCGQFGTADNLVPRKIWHRGRFGTADNLAPYPKINIGHYTIHRIYSANNWEICVSWRVFVRRSGAVCGNVNFEEYTFILDIHCQQSGNMCQLNIYICIVVPNCGGAKLSTVPNCPRCQIVRPHGRC